MKIKFNIVDGNIEQTLISDGISVFSHYELEKELDLDYVLETIKNTREQMLRYMNAQDAYL
jgi:hypothetical protein